MKLTGLKTIVLTLGLALLFLLLNVRFCPFFKVFHIPCSGCGITRAVMLIFQGRIIESFSYNILPVPIMFCVIFYLVLKIFNKVDKLNLFVLKNKTIFIVLLVFITVLVWIININNPKLY